jgi:hypothetical protein
MEFVFELHANVASNAAHISAILHFADFICRSARGLCRGQFFDAKGGVDVLKAG